jgi:hypothetical protein
MAMISVNRQVTQCTSPRLIAVNARHRQYWQSKLSIAAKRRAAMRIEVESTNNPKGELAPAKFRLDGVDIGVVEILEQWPGGHDHFFNVKDARDNTYLLRHAAASNSWELLMFLSKRGAEIAPHVQSQGQPRRGPPASNGRL